MRLVFAALIISGLALCAPGQAIAAPRACQSLGKLADAPGPLLLASYPDMTSGPLAHVAFLYDNAVAAIALVACGQITQARNIGDAILWALDHDRYWHDGRLRNGYAAGAMTDAPVKLAGWWDAGQNKWVEDQYQAGSDSGNLAWAMLALTSLYRASGDKRYLDGAKRIGAYVEHALDRRPPGGFTGGAFGDEPRPSINRWKSTEHNVDLAAAYARLGALTHEQKWQDLASDARRFVDAMWDRSCSCFAAGTGEDGATPNRLIALDAQIWPLLAVPGASSRFGGALDSARRDLGTKGGFAYSQGAHQSRDGVWTEGTAQAALLMTLTGADASPLWAAMAANRASGGGYYASSAGQAATGFMLETDPTKPRLYFHTPHLAALAWVALAEQRFNPFTGARALP